MLVFLLASLAAASVTAAAPYQVSVLGIANASAPLGYTVQAASLIRGDMSDEFCTSEGLLNNTDDGLLEIVDIEHEGVFRYADMCVTTDLLLHLTDFRVDYVVLFGLKNEPTAYAMNLMSFQSAKDGVVAVGNAEFEFVPAAGSAPSSIRITETGDSAVVPGVTIPLDGTHVAMSTPDGDILTSAYAVDAGKSVADVLRDNGIQLTEGPLMRARRRLQAATGQTPKCSAAASSVSLILLGALVLLRTHWY